MSRVNYKASDLAKLKQPIHHVGDAQAGSMDAQREAFAADLVERLIGVDKASHVSDNVILVDWHPKFDIELTIKIKKKK